MTKIKLLCAVADDRSSNLQGDIVGKPDDVAAAWIGEGIAIEAPEAEIAADRIAELAKALDVLTAERDDLARQVIDLQSKLAELQSQIEKRKADYDQLLTNMASYLESWNENMQPQPSAPNE
jgi:chromosome segregation ATPase